MKKHVSCRHLSTHDRGPGRSIYYSLPCTTMNKFASRTAFDALRIDADDEDVSEEEIVEEVEEDK